MNEDDGLGDGLGHAACPHEEDGRLTLINAGRRLTLYEAFALAWGTPSQGSEK